MIELINDDYIELPFKNSLVVVKKIARIIINDIEHSTLLLNRGNMYMILKNDVILDKVMAEYQVIEYYRELIDFNDFKKLLKLLKIEIKRTTY